MQVLIWILVMIAVTLILREPIRRWPWAVYLLGIAVDALVIFGSQYLGLSGEAWTLFYTMNRRAVPAFALFTIVMFVGCLGKGTRARRWVGPVRAELSILACIFTVPHVVFYLQTYQKIMFAGILKPSEITNWAYWSSIAFTALLAVLGVLSLRFLRKRIPYRVWKGIQRLSYLFFPLIWIHVILLRLRPNPAAIDTVLQSTWAYGLIVVVYAVCRIARYICDRRAARGSGHAKSKSPTVEAAPQFDTI